MILDLVKPHKISFIYLDKQKSFVPKKVTRFAQFHCNFIAVFSSTKYLFELTSGFFHTWVILFCQHAQKHAAVEKFDIFLRLEF
jgi:hypothetical protein